MKIDPKKIARMISEDPNIPSDRSDEYISNKQDDEYAGLEDADEFGDENGNFADFLNHYNVEAGYVSAGHGKLGVLYIDADFPSGDDEDEVSEPDSYITTIDNPKNEHWGIDNTYEIENDNENEWAIVTKNGAGGRAWYADDHGWLPGEPPINRRIIHEN